MSSPMPARAQTSAPEEQVDESPRAKRPRYFSYGEQDSDDEDSTNDPESYYGAASVELSQEVNDFVKATFKRCLPKQQRLHMAKEYPKPSGESVKVPKIDQEIRGALGKEFSTRRDSKLSKVQATVLATAAPIANFWSHLAEQDFSGKDEELIPVGEVLKVFKDTLVLIGNSSNYISQLRRKEISESMKSTRPKLSQFLQEVCKEDLGDSGAELFGPEVRKKILERANTIDAFNKALTKVESPASKNQRPQSRFLERGSNTRYGSGSSRNPRYIPYNRSRQNPSGSGSGGYKPWKSRNPTARPQSTPRSKPRSSSQ